MQDFREKLLVSGSGGQGILLAGRILAQSFVEAGLNTSWLPSYGMEMRGGTCNCGIVVSNKMIPNPIIQTYDTAIIMNQASYERFANRIKAGGVMVYDSSLAQPKASDGMDSDGMDSVGMDIYGVKATDIAFELGNAKCANMVMVGALVFKRKLVAPEIVVKVMRSQFKGEGLELNLRAFEAGLEGK